MKHSKTYYNSTVDDVPGFVSNFNKKTPEYGQRLGYTIVLEEAEKLHKWGSCDIMDLFKTNLFLFISLVVQAGIIYQKS